MKNKIIILFLFLITISIISGLSIDLKPRYFFEDFNIKIITLEGIEKFKITEIFLFENQSAEFNGLTFEVIGKSEENLIDLKIVNASPLAFKNALPTTTQSLETNEQDKLLWTSEGIGTTDSGENVTFWILVEGSNEKTKEKVTDEAEIIITLYAKEDSLLQSIGKKIFPSRPFLGKIIFFGIILLIIIIFWFYQTKDRILNNLIKLRERNKLKRKRMYAEEEGI